MARNLGIPYTEERPFYFISYNSEDEARVTEYAKELSECGFPMWYDNGLKYGEEWEVEIAEKIDSCQAVIMFLSKNIFLKENSYVHKEFELATEYSGKKVYVMMLDEIAKPEVPIRFRGWWTAVTRLQGINTYEYATPEECAQRLAQQIGIVKVQTEVAWPAFETVAPKNDIVSEKEANEPTKEDKVSPVNVPIIGRPMETRTRRLKMYAQSYGLTLRDELAGYINWLAGVRKLSENEIIHCCKSLISTSKALIDAKVCDKPLYCIEDINQLRTVSISVQMKNGRGLKNGKNVIAEYNSPAIMMYCQYVSEIDDVPLQQALARDEKSDRIIQRLKMYARSYGVDLGDELNAYIDYLLNAYKLPEREVLTYARSIISLSVVLLEFHLSQKPIFHIRDKSEILCFQNLIKDNEDLSDRDRKADLMYSKSLNRYYSFLHFVASGEGGK